MNSRIQSRVLYEQLDLPIFQNRMYDTASKPNEKPPPIMDTGRTSQLARLGLRLRFKLLSISSDPNKIVAHFLDVAGLVFDLVGEGIWPLVVDPAAAGAVGN